MKRSQVADLLFTLWFFLETVAILMFAVRRPAAWGPYYDLAPVMLVLYGFMLPAFFYIIYVGVVFLTRWRRVGSLAEAWRSLFAETWAQRSAVAFSIAFLVNQGYMLLFTFAG